MWSVLTAIKRFLNKDLQEANIILHKNNLSHARPERKDKYNHSFRVEEMREIVDILDDDNNAYIDTKHNNLVYIFEDKEDSSKINYIPIELDKKIKKFEKDNYVITLDKNKKVQFEDDLEKKRFIKVKQ